MSTIVASAIGSETARPIGFANRSGIPTSEGRLRADRGVRWKSPGLARDASLFRRENGIEITINASGVQGQ